MFDGRMDNAFINDDNVKQWDDVMDKEQYINDNDIWPRQPHVIIFWI